MSFNSVYTHNPSHLGPLPTSIFSRQATTYTSSLSNTSPTTSTSPYYHQIQNPPLTVLEHSHMAQKGNLPTTQWYPGSSSAMSFAPYQTSNGSMHSIVGMDDKKPIYPQHMPGHQGSTLAPTLPPPPNQPVHPSVDISNAANMVNSRAPTRQLTNSKRAAQNGCPTRF